MREAGTILLAFIFVLSVAYLIADNLILKKPIPSHIERAYIRVGISGALIGLSLYFIAS